MRRQEGNRSLWLAGSSGQRGGDLLDRWHCDNLLAVYTGKAISALTRVASDDDTGGYHTSRVMYNATAGMEYEIAIDSFSKDTGPVVLNWSLLRTQWPMPEITRAPQHTTVNWGGTAVLSVDYRSSVPVDLQWYRLDQPVLGATEPFLALNNVQDTDLGRYSVRLNNGEVILATVPVELQINSEGFRHALARNKQDDAVASGIASFAMQPVQPLQAVRPWRGALPRGLIKLAVIAPVAGYSGSQIFNNAPGKDVGEPNHCNIVGGSSYWFSYQAPASGLFSVNTDGSTFDTVLAVYIDDGRGLGYASLIPVACDNNSGSNGKTSAVVFPATSGQIYYIVVDGVSGATGIAYLNYNLNVYPTISSIANQTIPEDRSTAALGFTVGDRETPAGSVTVAGYSSNPDLVPASSFSFGGSGASRTVTVKPAIYHYGGGHHLDRGEGWRRSVRDQQLYVGRHPCQSQPHGPIRLWLSESELFLQLCCLNFARQRLRCGRRTHHFVVRGQQQLQQGNGEKERFLRHLLSADRFVRELDGLVHLHDQRRRWRHCRDDCHSLRDEFQRRHLVAEAKKSHILR